MTTLTRDQLAEMYYRMWLIRRFDQSAMDQYRHGRMRGTTHAYIGQEAIAVAICSLLRDDDRITSTHRGHGHGIAKGMTLQLTYAGGCAVVTALTLLLGARLISKDVPAT